MSMLRPRRRAVQPDFERVDRSVRLAVRLPCGGRLCPCADAAGGVLFIIRERPEDKGLLPYGATESMPSAAGRQIQKGAIAFGSATFLVTVTFSVLVYAVSGF